MNKLQLQHRARLAVARGLSIALLALCAGHSAFAQLADVAQVPLSNSTTNPVKANLLYILDDSGSMARDYMPDNVPARDSGKYAFFAAQCNGLAYNPATVYRVPVNADGTAYPAGTYTFPSTASAQPFYYTYRGNQPALAYTYNASGLDTTSTFYSECNSTAGSRTDIFTRVVMTPTSADVQNYRNWYTYYRTRMLMAKSATSLAFVGVPGSQYRVGFTTISSKRVSGTNFLDVADFAGSQKDSFFTNLFAATTNSSTPLRGALSKAGKYFAKKGTRSDGTAQTYDPVQLSCQKNFAILTTDGYWNTDDEVTGNSATSYGPDRLDNNDVGQQDSIAPRPMYDGGVVTSTVTTPMRQVQHWTRTRTRTQVTTEQQYEYRITTSGCSSGRSVVQRRTLTRTRTAAQTETTNYDRPVTYNSVVTITNGVASSPVRQGESFGSYTPLSVNIGSWVNGDWTAPSVSSYANSGSCQTAPVLPSPNPSTASLSTASASGWSSFSGYTAATPASSAAVATGPAVNSPATSSGGSQNSLADVAMYYYNTDLRTNALGNCTGAGGVNVCENNVAPNGVDSAVHQHLTTYTVGMGVNGVLNSANYRTGGSLDYEALRQGTRNWPVPGDGRGAENIDDLWHAAVNGRGQYFNAGDPTRLANSLLEALTNIGAQNGSGSGAAASTLQPVAGDSKLYIAKYTTVRWTGEVVARSIDPQTGEIGTRDIWSAEQRLDARVAGGVARNIYYMQRATGGNTGSLREFTYANLSADGVSGHFDNACGKTVPLTQCSQGGFDVGGANNGGNLVQYLRGAEDARYRTRLHKLGDIVGGAPVYVRKPPFQYTENDYAAFVATQASRAGVVYAAANDGMLHAFDGDTGEEKWAFVPTTVMDRMYRLADMDYANRHEFLVNGAPVVGDIFVGGAWKTILVGGLGAGGRGYYALDITNPDAPQALWEFANDTTGGDGNLGLSFGNPVITKRADNTWVVAFTSGYNNVAPGDGNGRLFVVNANTGERLIAMSTQTAAGVPAGTEAAPSGLGKLNAWVDSTIDNKALRYYAGDLLGNVWRFDIDSLVQPHNAALRLAYLRGGSPAVPQPITTQLALALVEDGGTGYPVVYAATGQLLGVPDLSSTAVQSLYAIKDPMNNTPMGDVGASADFVRQTLSEESVNAPRKVSDNPVNWATHNGWKVDFIGAGERVNVDMQVIFNSLSVTSNTLSSSACTAGGSSYLYNFGLKSGSAPSSSEDVVGTWLGNTLVVGLSYLTLQEEGGGAGSGRTVTVIVDNLGLPRTDEVPASGSVGATGRRTSWRELVQ
jgi:type IV pilus assembly protein PilY1